jgi:hypothetical protein
VVKVQNDLLKPPLRTAITGDLKLSKWRNLLSNGTRRTVFGKTTNLHGYKCKDQSSSVKTEVVDTSETSVDFY